MSETRPFLGEIYVHTCTTNEKSYVGQTTQGMAARWGEHVRHSRRPKCADFQYPISRAIRKYGPDAFEHQVLAVVGSKAELDNLEKVWIILLRTREGGYNITPGGEGNPGLRHTAEAKEKIAVGHRGKPLSAEHRAALSAAGKGNPKHGGGVPKGYKWSKERNENLRQAITGKKRPDLTLRNLQRWALFRDKKEKAGL